jgi:hypothetical protein
MTPIAPHITAVLQKRLAFERLASSHTPVLLTLRVFAAGKMSGGIVTPGQRSPASIRFAVTDRHRS